ncbi:LytTR family DNA-binding domain-containing protein [Reichenbachiella carrageenanivorans]|uniref:LytTR family DNA-binding domain-containing protein n=1 Tax=Reichenbachiella carrageenanivorans TaxID=2979869 RepID=A0ABY6D4W0_9BACT|nr:LytTR family DNA-binding domain-containing protein [Reichenbachiella carrageenanivorans]UXX80163.1 LytTR family DNA-binding domain-containing protein [Reichenbachiella carrageenanivorans]
MKAIIIDDERLARKELTSLLVEFPEIEIVDEAVNVDDAIEKIEKYEPDLIFLDIQMPDKTGFELLEMLEKTPLVVFTTAYDQFAIKAFEFNALDYLLKPIDANRLSDVVRKVLSQTVKPVAVAVETSEKLKSTDQVFVKDGEKCWFVKLENIRLFESDGNYIKVFFDGFRPMIHKSLNALDEKLDDKSFFRASRKHIINLGWVESIEPWFNGGLMVQLKGGEKVEVSRRQASKFKERMSL